MRILTPYSRVQRRDSPLEYKIKCVKFMDTGEMFAIQRGIAASLFDFVKMVSYPLSMKKK